MATDPEARAGGNSAVIIAVVALILAVGVGFLLMNRGAEAPDTTVVNNNPPAVNVQPPDVNVEAPAAPDVTVAPGTDSGASSSDSGAAGGGS